MRAAGRWSQLGPGPCQTGRRYRYSHTEATRHYDDQALAALLIQIAAINAWNRLNVPIRNPAGSYRR